MQSWAERLHSAFDDCTLDRDDMHAYQDGPDGAVPFLKANPFSALFIDMGLGKTVSSLTAIIDFVCDMEVECVLVIAPVRVANETWPTEIGVWHHTAPMTIARIRDDELVGTVNKAGSDARKILKENGPNDPRVQAFIRRFRELALRQRAKKLGYAGAAITAYGKAKIDEAMAKPVKPDEIKHFAAYCRQKAAAEAVRAHKQRNPATIYIINREQVEFLVNAWGKEWPYDCVFIDESSSLKDHTTKRWKALRRVRPFMKRMHQLTATPAAESYLHLYGQIGLLDMGKRLGTTYQAFTDLYFNHNKYTRKYTLKEGAKEAIAEKISDICLTMKAEDYLSLEEPIEVVRGVDLSPKERAFYDQMESESVVTLEGRDIEAGTAAALSSKLLQIASGVLYETYLLEDTDVGNDDYVADMKTVKQIHHVHDHKINDLKELVSEHEGETMLVVYHFKSSLARLQKAFPKAVAMDAAGTVVKKWQAGKIPMLLVHPQCLHPSTEVLTEHRGWVRIIDVSTDERVFDGVEFVNHSGCHLSGVMEVCEVFGLKMTPNHKLLIGDQWVEARDVGDSGSIRDAATYRYCGSESYLSEMFALRPCDHATSTECDSSQPRGSEAMPVLQESQRAQSDRHANMEQLVRLEIPSKGFVRQKLRWSRYWCMRTLAYVCLVLRGHGGFVPTRSDNRTHGRESRVLQRELHLGDADGATIEQAQQSDTCVRRKGGPPGRIVPTNGVESRYPDGKVELGHVSGRCGVGRIGIDVPEESKVAEKTKVYDLVDCGPRSRFLIRNSIGEVFISHNSAGHGLNLQSGGRHVVFFDLPWSLELYQQTIGRLARQGQKMVVYVHHIVCRGTMDELVLQCLRAKSDVQEGLFKLLKKIRRRSRK